MRGQTLWVSVYQDGKRVRKSTGLTNTPANRKKVERELLPMLEQLKPSKRVAYYYGLLMEQKDCTDSTRKRYDFAWRCQLAQFHDKDVSTVKVSDIRRWVSSLSVGPKTARIAVNLLRQILQEAVYDEAIEKNPCIVKLPKLDKFEPEPFSRDEMRLLLDGAEGWFRGVLAFMFFTGMRTGEVLALEWSDVGEFIEVSKSITDGEVSKTKTGNVRHVPAFDVLKPYIQEQRYRSGLGKRVFPDTTGAKQMKEPWQRLLRKVGMTHRVMYQARHTFAIHALDSGLFKVSQIAQILGHSSVQMLFQKYAKFIKSEMDEIPLNFSTLDTVLDTKVV